MIKRGQKQGGKMHPSSPNTKHTKFIKNQGFNAEKRKNIFRLRCAPPPYKKFQLGGKYNSRKICIKI